MNNIQIFNFKNNEFGLIRTLTLKGEPCLLGGM